MPNLFCLTGKVVLVTGGSRGLGWAMSQALAEAGATVVVNGRDEAVLAARVEELSRNGWSADYAVFDVAKSDAIAPAVSAVVDRHGRLDGLVNNAGATHRKPLPDFDTDLFQQVLDTNLTAPFVLAREAARTMTRQGGGRIVNIASIMGIVARPTISAYVAAKGGLAALTRALAVELGPQGITCNAIAPGYFATELNAPLVQDPEFTAFVSRRTPAGRWGEVHEMGGAAVFLISDAASYVNGHVLVVDGGMSVAL